MESIKEILTRPTPYSGSTVTFQLVKAELEKRYGPKVAEGYQPKFNTRTYNDWLKCGYRPKRGERAISSFVILEKRDKDNNVIRKYPRKVNLFFHTQVEKIKI